MTAGFVLNQNEEKRERRHHAWILLGLPTEQSGCAAVRGDRFLPRTGSGILETLGYTGAQAFANVLLTIAGSVILLFLWDHLMLSGSERGLNRFEIVDAGERGPHF